MPAKWDWPLASPLKLRANAVRSTGTRRRKRLVCRPNRSRNREPPERITLVPYGCTKFRVSMFPVTSEVK